MKKRYLKVAALFMAIVMVIGMLLTLRVIADAEGGNHVLQINPVAEGQTFMWTLAGDMPTGEQYTITYDIRGQGHYRVTYSNWGNGPDGCTVEETLDSDEWVTRTTTFTSGGGWAALVIYRHAGEGTLYLDNLVVTDSSGTRLADNGDFESGSDGWYGLNGTDFLIVEDATAPTDPDVGPVSEHILQINPVAEGQTFMWTLAGDMPTGEQYTITYDIRGQGHYRVTYSNWGNGPDGCTVEETLDSDEWVTRTTTFTSGGGWAALVIYRHAGEGTLYLDNLVVTDSSGTRLADNGDFESGSDGWYGLNGTDFVIVEDATAPTDPDAGPVSNHILQSNPVAQMQFMYTTTGWGGALTAGEQYTVSYRVKGRGHYRVTLSEWGNGSDGCTVEETLDSDEWVTRSTTFIQDNRWSAMIIYRHDSDGILYFDDLHFTDSQGNEYVSNGSFESGGDDWSGIDGSNFVILEENPAPAEPTVPVVEGNSLKVQTIGDGNHNYLLHQFFTVEANTNYTMSADVKGDAAARLMFRMIKDDWQGISGGEIDVQTSGEDDWETVSVTFQTGSYSGSATLGFYEWFQGTSGAMFIDNVSLIKEGTTENLVSNGNFDAGDVNGDPNWQWFPGWMGGANWNEYSLILTRDAVVTGSTVTPADPGDTVPVADAYTINWADKEIVVDGVFSEEEWSDANALHLTGMTGRRDTCSGTLYFKYDGCCVYMAAVVNDPTPMRNGGTGDNIWWGDSLELFYGTDLSQRNEMSDQDIQVLISGSEEYGDQNTFHYGDEKVYQAFKDMDVGLRTDENGNEIGYTVEAIIPLELFRVDEAPWTGEQILFNANIKDGDGGQIGWTNTEEAGKCDPGTWKLVTFAVHAAPADDITVGATVDPTTRVVTLTGQAVRAERQQLTVLVTDANGSIAYVNQFQSNDDGSYTLRFPVHEAGVYTVTVGGKRIKKPVSTTLTLENTLKI